MEVTGTEESIGESSDTEEHSPSTPSSSLAENTNPDDVNTPTSDSESGSSEIVAATVDDAITTEPVRVPLEPLQPDNNDQVVTGKKGRGRGRPKKRNTSEANSSPLKKRSRLAAPKRTTSNAVTPADNTIAFTSDLLSSEVVAGMAQEWLHEVQPSFDLANVVLEPEPVTLALFLRSSKPIVLAGYRFVEAILKHLGVSKTFWSFEEGSHLMVAPESEVPVMNIELAKFRCPQSGAYNAIEELLPRVLQRCSSVASAASQLKTALLASGWAGQLTGGSGHSTIGSFGRVEQYGMMLGAGANHCGFIEITANGLAASKKTVNEWISLARKLVGSQSKFKVHINSLGTAVAALDAGADILQLKLSVNPDPAECTLDLETILALVPAIKSHAIATVSSSRSVLIEVEIQGYLYTGMEFDLANPHIDIISYPSLLSEDETEFMFYIVPLV